MEQELGDNVTLQEIEVVSTWNITKVKCPMIFKRFLFFIIKEIKKRKKRKKEKRYFFFVMLLDGCQTIYHFAILEGM